MDIYLFRFDLKDFLNQTYTVNAYIDEYQKGQEPKRIRTLKLGKNIASLNDVPEEHRKAFREIKQVPEGKNEWDNIKEMSVYIRKSNDSTAVFTLNIPDVLRTNQSLKLRPIEKYNSYVYYPRPFQFKPVKTEEKLTIPCILYASAWLDTQYNFIRFCGEKEIDPEMKANILLYVPHYYVLGLEFQKEEKPK